MLNHKSTVPLQTKHLLLRRFAEDDLESVYNNMTSDPEMTKYLAWDAHHSPDETEILLQKWVSGYTNPEFYRWAIVFDNEVIGSIHFPELSNKHSKCEIGYYIGSKWWGKGFTSEAAKEIARYAFEDINAHKLKAWHHSDNTASGLVLQKLGMIIEGEFKQEMILKDGTYSDIKEYGLLKDTWDHLHR